MDDGKVNIKMIALIVVLVIIITGIMSFTFFTFFSVSENNTGENGKVKSVKDLKPTYSVGDFVVNLSGSSNMSFIKANIVFELEDKDMVEELDKRKPQIRDEIISILRAQSKKLIEEPEAKTIKSMIQNSINQLLISGKIHNVWFTELVVQ
ncbi:MULTISPECIES: flagellar basal body-associated protein FliL [unclassified Halanaerobium]|uniref:flagellar basal body-associated FliL family protein n=1 Tax=unclassified Halanaerobium TaxID=2641197 RepID=UPI000DF3C9E5|nr:MULTISPECIES: flagellar basal body-associated FliL family protein [unclassified Halanaerobium]RCW47682.1 flagellar FliL protein [Halanaerobium sp. MA284_MarDTE_T2]RCW84674.1 flagellar FliL protein [Halanaerobium sp. DL-01]